MKKIVLKNNLKDNFSQIFYCEFEKIEKKESENIGDKGGNGEDPDEYPENESIDESIINNLYKKRLLMFDAIGVPKNLQEIFGINMNMILMKDYFNFLLHA